MASGPLTNRRAWQSRRPSSVFIFVFPKFVVVAAVVMVVGGGDDDHDAVDDAVDNAAVATRLHRCFLHWAPPPTSTAAVRIEIAASTALLGG